MEDQKYAALMNKLIEVSERTVRIETKQESVDRRLSEIEKEDARQNDLLAEHIAGTVENRKQIQNEKERREALASAHEKLKGRVERLETTPKVKKFLADRIMWIALVAGGIAAVLLLFKK